jgi:hypothetical protein
VLDDLAARNERFGPRLFLFRHQPRQEQGKSLDQAAGGAAGKGTTSKRSTCRRCQPLRLALRALTVWTSTTCCR